ncbi:hypothetical protein [Actinocorallia longicatena]|uniref:Cell wall-active antibiotics response LiaF-like C-terminal domain-containing protein n=1 Tax=Actinocorallia longicatena TaxID=111803 RepID=A0ABP6Q746_9ACTN
MAGTGVRRRGRAWFGLVALAAGSFVIGDVHERLREAVAWVGGHWPWLVLGWAGANVVRSAVAAGSLIAPALLVAAALAGLGLVGVEILIDVLAPALLITVGAVLVRSSAEPGVGAWTRVLVSGRVTAPAEVGHETPHARFAIRAVAGEVRADFAGSVLAGGMDLEVTAIAGHVHLTVPRSWPVVVRTAGTVFTHVSDTGPRSGDAAAEVGLHLLGLCGAVSLVRV